jgi:adenylate cyclase
MEGDEEKIKAIDAGADDFVTKPFNAVLLLARVRSLLRIKRLHDELEARNRILRQAFRRYVDEDVADVILADPERYLKLGGETRPVCVLFADIRGFTRLAERLEAQEVVSILNIFFTRLTDAILQNRGTLDKYIGDEIMAFFGAPVATADTPLNALRTALQMQDTFHQISASLGKPIVPPLGLGIGVHYGPAAVGNIGSERLMNYTVIGDTVNTAHRLVEIAGPGEVLLTEDVYKQVGACVQVELLEPKKLPGKRTPIVAYRLQGLLNTAADCEDSKQHRI